MGCDIHMVLQRRTKEGWRTVKKDLYEDRNYRLFSVLAGVRGIEPGVFRVNGLPKDDPTIVIDDCGSPLIEDFWIGDHTHSFIHLDSYFSKKMGAAEGAALAPLTFEIMTAVEECQPEDEIHNPADWRIVFGFDS